LKYLESYTIEGDSPVNENMMSSVIVFPSTPDHVKVWGNLGGPPSKAKYVPSTDSEQVP
jgi:hypothetical protein